MGLGAASHFSKVPDSGERHREIDYPRVLSHGGELLMADSETNTKAQDAESHGGGRSQDEVALELMKFIAVTTGYGKSSQGSAGFSGKPATRSGEDYADALLELFERCRKVVKES
jgi:hypothetical protein